MMTCARNVLETKKKKKKKHSCIYLVIYAHVLEVYSRPIKKKKKRPFMRILSDILI